MNYPDRNNKSEKSIQHPHPTVTLGGDLRILESHSSYIVAGIFKSENNLTYTDPILTSFNKSILEAKYAIIFDSAKVELIESTLTSPLIFFRSEEYLDNQNSQLNGKVLYLSDPATCEQYGTEEFLVDICASQTHSEL